MGPYRDQDVPMPAPNGVQIPYTAGEWSKMSNPERAIRSWLYLSRNACYYGREELVQLGSFILDSPSGRRAIGL